MLKTGGDPRALPNYATLRDQLSRLPRSDVDWCRIEHLSLSLFRQNGVELQIAAWYTVTRMQLARSIGLNEGLDRLEAVISRQWRIVYNTKLEIAPHNWHSGITPYCSVSQLDSD
ncbi:type VI secretion system ImpA family N-terminal domain-containing protein [Serratia ureilytica]|nr:type VI secretion system ImpA family N-terminal domain-containing protein [Serratia ureilytica]